MSVVAGIDVGGVSKGFHAAILSIDQKRICEVQSFHSVDRLCEWIKPLDPLCIAIDGPRRQFRRPGQTRLSERQLHALGYRIQWTRVDPDQAPEWMVQSTQLWAGLKGLFVEERLAETFPTAACTSLAGAEVDLSLSLLAGIEKRATYKDYVDACIAAWVAYKVLTGVATEVGIDLETGETDEQGPIYF